MGMGPEVWTRWHMQGPRGPSFLSWTCRESSEPQRVLVMFPGKRAPGRCDQELLRGLVGGRGEQGVGVYVQDRERE